MSGGDRWPLCVLKRYRRSFRCATCGMARAAVAAARFRCSAASTRRSSVMRWLNIADSGIAWEIYSAAGRWIATLPGHLVMAVQTPIAQCKAYQQMHRGQPRSHATTAHPSGEVAFVDGLLVGHGASNAGAGLPEAASPRPWWPRLLCHWRPPERRRQTAAHRHARLSEIPRSMLQTRLHRRISVSLHAEWVAPSGSAGNLAEYSGRRPGEVTSGRCD